MNSQPVTNLPQAAQIQARRQDASTIFTWDLCLIDEKLSGFQFKPGQFNMLSLFGVGEVAISISSDPDEYAYFSHTIRAVGRVTKALQNLKVGDYIGVRGPYGNGWPLQESIGKDVVIITGGLGCAPTVSVINYILSRRDAYGSLKILQGVKHSDDFVFRKQYDQWKQMPRTEIFIAADKAGPKWPFQVGYITDMINQLRLEVDNTIVMMCGPQSMMAVASLALKAQGLSEKAIYLSMERNMECAIGHCGHCQYGGLFICKDGPIFTYDQIKPLIEEAGF